MAINIDLLLFMGNVSRNLFTYPQQASAPTVPFGPNEIGSYTYLEGGQWQRNVWNGESWVPQPGEYASGSIKEQLDDVRADVIQRPVSEQAAIGEAFNRAFPTTSPPLGTAQARSRRKL